MNVHERVIAPRIVEPHPLRRVVWSMLLLAGLVAAVWYAFDYGRAQVPAGSCAEGDQAEPAAGRVAVLEQQRDTLQQRVAELEEALQQLSGCESQAETAADPADESAETDEPDEAAESGREESGSSEPPDGTLAIDGLRIDAVGAESRFRYGFTVRHGNNGSAPVYGTIWIAVNGLENGKPARLSLKRVSADRITFVKMNFERRQAIEGELVLPDRFVPRNLMVEVKPTDEAYSGVSETLEWPAAE